MQYTQAQIIALKRQKLIDLRKAQADAFFKSAREQHLKLEAQRLQEYQKQQRLRRK